MDSYVDLELKEGGLLGIGLSSNLQRLKDASGIETDKVAVYVTEIGEESNAYKAGVRMGDILESIFDKDGGNLPFTPENFELKWTHVISKVERPIRLLFKSNTSKVPVMESFSVDVSSPAPPVLEGFCQLDLAEGVMLGLRLTCSTELLAVETGFETDETGVYVLSAKEGSMAISAGVKPGDKLEAMIARNGTKLDLENVDLDWVHYALQHAERPLRLLFKSCEWNFKIIKEGYLEKKNKTSTMVPGLAYSRRWFELNSRNFSYMKKKGEKTGGKEVVPLRSIIRCCINESEQSSPHFLVYEPERGYKLRCEDEEERDEWVQAINEQLNLMKSLQDAVSVSIERSIQAQMQKFSEAERAKGKTLAEISGELEEEQSRRRQHEAKMSRSKDAAAPLMPGDIVWWEPSEASKGMLPPEYSDEVFVRARVVEAEVGTKATFEMEYQRWNIVEPMQVAVLGEASALPSIDDEDNADGEVVSECVICEGDRLYRASIAVVSSTPRSKGNPDAELTNLSPLNEATIMKSLRDRYEAECIYSYIGPTLVAVNWFSPEDAAAAYSEEKVLEYINEEHCRGRLPPHIFAVAREVYFRLMATGSPQAIVITGESGAGKSFSAHKILEFLAEVSATNAEASAMSTSMLQTSPILEAFGYAKMPRNDDSSRFGKLIKLFFNSEGAVCGGRIETYLLEKSRVCQHGQGSRSFHIFYLLLAHLRASPPGWLDQLELPSLFPKDYVYLEDGPEAESEEVTAKQAERFQGVAEALDFCGFGEEEQIYLWKTLSIIMKLGNISFEDDGNEKSQVTDMAPVEVCARMLGTEPDALADALTTREFKNPKAGSPPIKFKVAVDMAFQNRDALAKSIYSGIFDLLVEQINDVFEEDKLEGFEPDLPIEEQRVISVLDIFGFEVLNHNSLEQFLINVANEQLNDYFQNHMYAEQTALLEKESLLDSEGASFFHQHLTVICNEQTSRLTQLRTNILQKSLNEISKTPFGTDEEFMNLVVEHTSDSDIVEASPANFTVNHFAAAVEYDPLSFVDKNKFRLYDNLKSLIESCSQVFLHKLIAGEASEDSQQLSERFMSSLDELLQLLSVSVPRFVRCIKSNTAKEAWQFEPDLIHRQLRYASLLQTVRICSTGYPEQLSFELFYMRCRPLFAEAEEVATFEATFPAIGTQAGRTTVPMDAWKEGATLMLGMCGEKLGQWITKSIRIGGGTVMLREDASQALDNERRRLEQRDEQRTRSASRTKTPKKKRNLANKMKDKLCSIM